MSLCSAILLLIATATAAPLASQHENHLSKRSGPSARTVGTGISIAIAIIVFTVLVFYLGVRRGQTGSWFCWRDPPYCPTELPYPIKTHLQADRDLKSSIGFPKSGEKVLYNGSFGNQLISPIDMNDDEAGEKARPVELSPVEARPRIIELSPIDVHGTGGAAAGRPRIIEQLPNETTLCEAGIATPRRGRFDRKSWFGSASRKSRAASSRNASLPRDKEISIYEMPTTPSSAYHEHDDAPPALPQLPPAYAERGREKHDDAEVDWSGLEYLRGIYADRKSIHKDGKGKH